MVQALNSILTSYSVQVAVQNGYADASAAGSRRSDITRPLIRLWIVPGNEIVRRKRPSLVIFFLLSYLSMLLR